MSDVKPTEGPWRDHVMVLSRNNQKGLLRQENTIVRRGRDVIAMVFGMTADEEKANAALIAEAGAAYHETGLTPRELADRLKQTEAAHLRTAEALGCDATAFEPSERAKALVAQVAQFAEQRAELLEALEALRNEVSGKPRPDMLRVLVEQAGAAIAKARGGSDA